MEKIILIGGGDHCRSLLDTLSKNTDFEVFSIVDHISKVGTNVYGYEIKHTDDDLQSLYDNGIRTAFITVGSVGNFSIREKLYRRAKEIGFTLPVIIDNSAVVSKFSSIKEGTFVGKGAIVSIGCTIDEMAIINTGAVIDHDSTIGKFSVISPSVAVAGGVNIGEYSYIGINSTVIQAISIGSGCLIGAASNVVKNIPDNVKAYGNPCKEVGTWKSRSL